MSRMKELTIEAANHDVDRSECTVCGHLPATVPPCHEWERVELPAAYRYDPEPVPEPVESKTPLVTPWDGC
jgi:hypothetical protein